MKYAAVYEDENWIVTNYYSTEKEAIDQLESDSGEKWEDLENNYTIQGFSDAEIKKIAAQPDV